MEVPLAKLQADSAEVWAEFGFPSTRKSASGWWSRKELNEVARCQMYLFLDFDGVLHAMNRLSPAYFSRTFMLAEWLYRWPSIDVVISSNWRHHHTMQSMIVRLGPVGPRVVGCTPTSADGRWDQGHDFSHHPDRHSREDQIRKWLAENGAEDRKWVALDDQPQLFSPTCSQLVVCNSRTGITDKTLRSLTKRATSAGLKEEKSPRGLALEDLVGEDLPYNQGVPPWLSELVSRIVLESGRPQGFNVEAWLTEWLGTPNSALGGKLPSAYLATKENRMIVGQLILRMQSGAYS